MRKITDILFLMVLTIFCILLPSSVKAQTTPAGAEPSQRWVCLEPQPCTRTFIEQGGNCPGGVASHRFVIGESSDPLSRPLKGDGNKIYVFQCIVSDDGRTCTTGNPAVDKEALGVQNENFAQLRQKYQYEFLGFRQGQGATAPNPVVLSNNSTFGPYSWTSKTPSHLPSIWLALNLVTEEEQGEQQNTGNNKTQQQAQLNFERVANNCKIQSFDPYGIVFDSQTLEPIPQANVELSVKDGDKFRRVTTNDTPGITNPFITNADGLFSFVVPDGTYKLSLSNATILENASDSSALHPNFSKIYSDIYKPDEEIVQVGKIQHRDIPVATKGTNNPVKVISRDVVLDAGSRQMSITGKVSHPCTKINAYSKKNNARFKLVKSVSADKTGNFTLSIDQAAFEPTEVFGELEYQKVDLRTVESCGAANVAAQSFWNKMIGFIKNINIIPVANAQESVSQSIDPIPTYLEGVAYDKAGKPIPNATVGIYLTFSDRPYYQTTADEKGMFRISSSHIPAMPYSLKYKTVTGAIIEKTTTEFITQNSSYIEEKKVALYANVSEKGEVKKFPTAGPSGTQQGGTAQNGTQGTNGKNNGLPGGFGNNNASAGKNSTNDLSNPANNSNFMLIAIILLVLLGGSGVMLAVYLAKRNSSSMY